MPLGLASDTKWVALLGLKGLRVISDDIMCMSLWYASSLALSQVNLAPLTSSSLRGAVVSS